MDISDIREEAAVILKHGCKLEDIEYYLPGFHEPLKRKVGLSDEKEMDRFLEKLDHDPERMEDLRKVIHIIWRRHPFPYNFWSGY